MNRHKSLFNPKKRALDNPLDPFLPPAKRSKTQILQDRPKENITSYFRPQSANSTTANQAYSTNKKTCLSDTSEKLHLNSHSLTQPDVDISTSSSPNFHSSTSFEQGNTLELLSSQEDLKSLSEILYHDDLDDVLKWYDVDASVELKKVKDQINTEHEILKGTNASDIQEDPNISYYLSNFVLIVSIVEQRDKHLFEESELQIFEKLKSAPLAQSKLFARILYRKGPWYQVSKLSYSDIPNIQGVVDGLLKLELIEEPSQGLIDLLPLLSNQQLRTLTKSPSSFNRDKLMASAVNLATTQRTFSGGFLPAPKELGQCIRIRENVNNLFKLVHRLFYLNHVEDQTVLMMIQTGKVKFPTYFYDESIIHKTKLNYGNDSQSFMQTQEIPDTPPTSPQYEPSFEEMESVHTFHNLSSISSSNSWLNLILRKSSEKSKSTENNLAGLGVLDTDENLHILSKIGFNSVFKTRKDLDEYESALEDSHQLAVLIGSEIDLENDTTDNERRKKQMPNPKNLNDPTLVSQALSIVDAAAMKFVSHLSLLNKTHNMDSVKTESDFTTFTELTPSWSPNGEQLFLNRFSAFWVYSSIMWVGVGILERQRRYEDATSYLQLLLSQLHVNQGRRGEWWQRLIFDLDHIKQVDQAIKMCKEAIGDRFCRPQHLMAIYDKLRVLLKIKARRSNSPKNTIPETPKSAPKSAPKSNSGKRSGKKSSAQAQASPVEVILRDSDSTTSNKFSSLELAQSKLNAEEQSETPISKRLRRRNSNKDGISLSYTKIPIPTGTNLEHSPPFPQDSQANLSENESGTTDLLPNSNNIADSQTVELSQANIISPSIQEFSTPVVKIRHISPTRYRILDKSQNGSPDKISEGEIKPEESRQIISPEFIGQLTELGIPIPPVLHMGSVHIIYGNKIKPPDSVYGWGNRAMYVDSQGHQCSVEEFSLDYYMTQSDPIWPKGVHCEGTPYSILFSLLFWDILFDANIPYVFQHPFQDAPLDLTTEAFYWTRKSSIDERLNKIYHNSSQISINISFSNNIIGPNINADNQPFAKTYIGRMISNSYFKYHGMQCRGVSWKSWSYSDLMEIAECLGGPVIALFCERLAFDYRFTHSGLPDLLLWDPVRKLAKLVEVKSPSDKLSEKQIVWIDALARRGCDIVTLYVKNIDQTVQKDPIESTDTTDDLNSQSSVMSVLSQNEGDSQNISQGGNNLNQSKKDSVPNVIDLDNDE